MWHLNVALFLLCGICVGLIEARSYSNGLIFYDLATHTPYLPPTVSVSRGRNLASAKYSEKGSIWSTFGQPCVCRGVACGCCAGLKVDQYKFDQKDKIVIPEKIAIRLLNSSEVTAEQFYRHILDQYRILNHLQQQRQQFLQKQHLQLQQLEASNRFQEVFATATIIQAHPHPHSRDPLKKLLSPGASSLSQQNHNDSSAFRLESPAANMDVAAAAAAAVPPSPHHMPIVLDTSPPGDMNAMSMMHLKRKTHRGHYKHHRSRGGGGGGGGVSGQKKPLSGGSSSASTTSAAAAAGAAAFALGGEQPTPATPHGYMDTPLNPAAGTIVQQPQLQLYTSMPIPLILSPSNSEKRPMHHSHSHVHGERRGGGGGGGGNGGGGGGGAQARRRTTTATVSGYDAQTYLNPFLTGELIFEK